METVTNIELPRYQCHKQVWALKIKEVLTDAVVGPYQTLVFENGRYAPIQVTDEWVEKHKPQTGGYYVVYKDGYASYSPADAFEGGYKPEQAEFRAQLAAAINRHSKESGSNTPDFILADYLGDCLDAFDRAAQRRREWYAAPDSTALPDSPNPSSERTETSGLPG